MFGLMHLNEGRRKFVSRIMEAETGGDRCQTKSHVRRTSMTVALSVVCLLSLPFMLSDWIESKALGPHARTNRYFRFGDPFPLAFPVLRSDIAFSDLEKNPRGGEIYDNWGDLEWRPQTGPFDDIRAERPERTPADEAPKVFAAYHIRPQYLKGFKNALDDVLANQVSETGNSSGEQTWPDVRGARLRLHDGIYSIFPLEPDDDGISKVTYALKRFATATLWFCFVYWVVSIRMKRRLTQS